VADVSILVRAEASLCRQHQVNPRYFSALILAECKYYSTPLKLDLSCSFLGFSHEMRVTDCLFVANQASANVSKVLTHGQCKLRTSVLPNTSSAENILHQFRTKFDQFLALN
jgi:hypothetical protein